MPNLPLARRPRRDMQFGNCEMENFTIKWLTNLVAQDVWSYELLLVEYYPQVVLCFDVFTAFTMSFLLFRSELWVQTLHLESQASPTLGCRGKPLEAQNFCRIEMSKGMNLSRQVPGTCRQGACYSTPENRTEESKLRVFSVLCGCQDLLPDLYTPQFGVELHAEQIQPYLSNGSWCPGRFPLRALYPMSSWKAGHCSDF